MVSGLGLAAANDKTYIPSCHSHFWACSAKDDIFNTLNSHYLALGVDPFTRIPATYLIEPKKSEGEEWPGWADFAGMSTFEAL